jgi:outer membrane receptor protein involved in Fe transport
VKLALQRSVAFLAVISMGLAAESPSSDNAPPQVPATAPLSPSPASSSSATPTAAGAPVKLDAFEVTARQQQFYNSIDRKVYSVGQDVVSTTGSASDLLQNVPSIQVDVAGNVSLRGDTGVEILINGKPSAMMGRNRAAALEQMPAGEIERVEVITNPSARFRPDGSAGIINLVMKRDRLPGFSGSVRANAGNEERYNAAVSLSLNPGRYTIHGNASLRQDSRPDFQDEDRSRFDLDGNPLGSTSQRSATERQPLSRFARIGGEYKLDTTTFGASIEYDHRDYTRHVTQQNISRDARGAVTRDYDRLRRGEERESEYEFAFTFERGFDGRDHELSAELRLGKSSEEADNQFTNVHRPPEIPVAIDTTRVRESEQDTDLSIDYVRPLAHEARLELGYEGEREETDLDFRASNLDALTGTAIPDLRQTNRFLYDGVIHALYATYGRPFGRFGLLGGLRVEHAIIDTHQVTTRIAGTNRYWRLYPSLHLSHRFTDAHQLQLSYSHRVNRPDGDELNPFIEYDDPFNLEAGNPDLMPEDVHSIEAGYQYDHNNTSYLASVYFRRRENGFTEITRALDENTLLTTDENLATSQSFGLELGATTRLKDRLAINFSANAFHQEIDAANLGFADRRSTLAWNAKLNTSWEATDRLLVQLTTGYRAHRLTAQGERHPSHITNLGLRYDLRDRRTSIVLTVSDVFRTLRDRTTLDTPTLKGDITRRRNSQVIYVGLIYNFGRAGKKDRNLEFDEVL